VTPGCSAKTVVLRTSGKGKLRDTLAAIFGAKQVGGMACMPCRCRQPATPSVASMLMAHAFIHVYMQIHARALVLRHKLILLVCVRGQLGSLVEFQLKPPADDEADATCNDQPKITGWLSKPTHGLGRGASDRQFVSVNRRTSGDRPLEGTDC